MDVKCINDVFNINISINLYQYKYVVSDDDFPDKCYLSGKFTYSNSLFYVTKTKCDQKCGFGCLFVFLNKSDIVW